MDFCSRQKDSFLVFLKKGRQCCRRGKDTNRDKRTFWGWAEISGYALSEDGAFSKPPHGAIFLGWRVLLRSVLHDFVNSDD